MTLAAKARVMPRQKPRRSVQEVATPVEFIAAASKRFGALKWDLAANADNAINGMRYYGPGSAFAEDSLAMSWAESLDGLSNLWLNPPYANITTWARKCAEESARGARILLLVPASVGSNWFNRWVRPFAYVLELTPRIKFVNHKAGYPKDLVLCVYGPERFIGRDTWRWTSEFDGMAGAA